MAQIQEVIGDEEAQGEQAGADVLLEATDTEDPTKPVDEEPEHQADVDMAPLLELVLGSWNAIATTRCPKWVFSGAETTALARAWAPVAQKYAGDMMSVEAAAVIATIPILVPRLMAPKVIDVEAEYVDPDKRTSEVEASA